MHREDTSRTPQQIARDALKAAEADGIVKDWSLRPMGRATVYPAFGDYGKFYTESTLDTLTLLDRLRMEKAGHESMDFSQHERLYEWWVVGWSYYEGSSRPWRQESHDGKATGGNLGEALDRVITGRADKSIPWDLINQDREVTISIRPVDGDA